MRIKEGVLPVSPIKIGDKCIVTDFERITHCYTPGIIVSVTTVYREDLYECPYDNPDSKWYQLISEKEALKIIKDFS